MRPLDAQGNLYYIGAGHACPDGYEHVTKTIIQPIIPKCVFRENRSAPKGCCSNRTYLYCVELKEEVERVTCRKCKIFRESMAVLSG